MLLMPKACFVVGLKRFDNIPLIFSKRLHRFVPLFCLFPKGNYLISKSGVYVLGKYLGADLDRCKKILPSARSELAEFCRKFY